MTKKQKYSLKRPDKLIIVGPMKFPWSSITKFLKVQSVNHRLIFIDGGLGHINKFRQKVPHLLKNSISMGDGDSTKLPMTLVKTNQNISDLAFALSQISGKSCPRECLLVGFLGGRIDHQLFNFGEIALYLQQFSNHNAPVIKLDNKIIFVGSGNHEVNIQGIFSLASFLSNEIKISGECEYKTTSWLKLKPLSSRGVSNVGFGAIKIATKKPLAIICN